MVPGGAQRTKPGVRDAGHEHPHQFTGASGGVQCRRVGRFADVGVLVDLPSAGSAEVADERDVGLAVDAPEVTRAGRGSLVAVEVIEVGGVQRGLDRHQPRRVVGMVGGQRPGIVEQRRGGVDVDHRLRPWVANSTGAVAAARRRLARSALRVATDGRHPRRRLDALMSTETADTTKNLHRTALNHIAAAIDPVARVRGRGRPGGRDRRRHRR